MTIKIEDLIAFAQKQLPAPQTIGQTTVVTSCHMHWHETGQEDNAECPNRLKVLQQDLFENFGSSDSDAGPIRWVWNAALCNEQAIMAIHSKEYVPARQPFGSLPACVPLGVA